MIKGIRSRTVSLGPKMDKDTRGSKMKTTLIVKAMELMEFRVYGGLMGPDALEWP
jgi:hypothetical protein